MPSNPSIFSTYSQGENRVTSTILAVFEKLSVSTVTTIIQRLTQEETLDLVTFTNQPTSKNGSSVPDGKIRGYFEYWIETKIKAGALSRTQLRNHLAHINASDVHNSKLIVLTPDEKRPEKLDDLPDNGNIFWANFDHLVDSVEKMLEESSLLLTDREKFLLVELKTFINNEGLLSEDFSNRVLVVPASRALGFYKKHKAYVCQPFRSFQKSSYLAFYKENRIYNEVPKILGYVENINLKTADYDNLEVVTLQGSRDEIIRRLKLLKEHVAQQDHEGFNKVFILSENEDQGTVVLEEDIKNNKQSGSGRRTAFVQGQRYVDIQKMKSAKTTTDLER